MQQLLAVTLLSLCTVTFADNLGHVITNFVDNVGRGAEKLANDVADSVDRFVMDNEDLDMKRRADNQQAIDAFKRGDINESQLRTAMWISQYEYQQAVDDRIRNKYAGGNSYGGYYGTPPAYSPNSYGNQNSYSNQGSYSGQAQRDPGYGNGYNPNPYGSTYPNGYSNPNNGYNNNNAYGATTYYDPGNGIGIFDKKKN